MALDDDEEPAPIGYSWRTFASGTELQQEIARMRSVPRTRDTGLPRQQPCDAQVAFDGRDAVIRTARLILKGYLGADTETEQVIYDGPVADRIILSLPVHAPPDTLWIVSEGKAFAEETRQMTAWHAMSSFEFTCDGRPLTITLANEYDIEGTGGNMRIDRGVAPE